MNMEIDATDAKLLQLLQISLPVVPRPFLEIGEKCGIGEEDVMQRLLSLKAGKILRQISAIFDSRSLGYASSLVASRIDPSHVDAAAEILNQHPGVSHNYLRNHSYNLWYTIAVPPTSALGLEATVKTLHTLSGAEETRLLPTLKLFKIGVRFDIQGMSKPDDSSDGYFSESNRSEIMPLDESERRFVHAMQRDLPIVHEPFGAIAEELGISIESLAKVHKDFLASGRMRRFAAVLHHRKAGFSANAMGVWAPDTTEPDELNRLGSIMAGFRAVSHCYLRPVYPDWPFSLFTMVHGKSPEECEETLSAIAAATGITHRDALYSTKEFKKVRVRYFTGAEEAWEAKYMQ